MKDTTGGQLQKDLESIDRFHKDKCPHGALFGQCPVEGCAYKLSPSDKTWSEVDEVTETIRNGKYVEAHIVKDFLTSATIKAREIGYQEGFDKGYETASGERHWE
jgi:hypothetical protein